MIKINKDIASNMKNNELDDIEYFKMVNSGLIKRFPNGFWDGANGLESARIILTYLFEEVLTLDLEKLPKTLNRQLIKKYKLDGMFVSLFNRNFFKAVELVYPGKYKEFQFRLRGWTDEIKREAMIWVIECKLENNDTLIKDKLGYTYLSELGLASIYSEFNTLYDCLNSIYPDRFYPWEFNNIPMHYWSSEENVKLAVRWLVEIILENNDENVYNKFSSQFLIDNNLKTLGARYSKFELLELAFPNRFDRYKLRNVGRGFYSEVGRNRSIVLKLCEIKYNCNMEVLQANVTTDEFSREVGAGAQYVGTRSEIDALILEIIKEQKMMYTVLGKFLEKRLKVNSCNKTLVQMVDMILESVPIESISKTKSRYENVVDWIKKESSGMEYEC